MQSGQERQHPHGSKCSATDPQHAHASSLLLPLPMGSATFRDAAIKERLRPDSICLLLRQPKSSRVLLTDLVAHGAKAGQELLGRVAQHHALTDIIYEFEIQSGKGLSSGPELQFVGLRHRCSESFSHGLFK